MDLRLALSAGCALLVTIPIARAAEPLAIGPQHQVNAYTTGFQRGWDLDALPGGDFIVVWESTRFSTDPDDVGFVLGRRVDARGRPIGAELRLDDADEPPETDVDVGVGPDGSFVVAWSTYRGHAWDDDDEGDVLARRFASSGAPIGASFRVSAANPLASRGHPAVGVLVDGSSVIVWYDNAGERVQGRRYDSAGTELGSAFVVAELRDEPQYAAGRARASVAPARSGDFVVVWDELYCSIICLSEVGARRYGSDGSPSGDAIGVGPFGFGPRASAAEDGGWVVAWSRIEGYYGLDAWGARAMRLDAAGEPASEEVDPGASHRGYRWASTDVAPGSGGRFLVVWADYDFPTRDADGDGIRARLLDASLAPSGPSVIVNSYATSRQDRPRVVGAGEDSFLVVWTSRGSPGDDDFGDSVQARAVDVVELVFRDGFEGGSTQRWSLRVP